MWIPRRELRRLLGEIRFWQQRSEALEIKLAQERERNRQREELLVDRVLATKGTYPITEPPKRETPRPAERELTAIEEAELEMYERSAVENGYGPEIGRRLWERKRKGEPLGWEEFGEMGEIEN